MRVTCKKCGHMVESLIIDKQIAFEDVLKQLGKHGLRQHPQENQAIQMGIAKVMTAATLCVWFEEMAHVSEQEEYIETKLEEAQELLMLAAGFDMGDEEEEEEEDTEDDEDSKCEVEEIDMPSNGSFEDVVRDIDKS